MSDSKSRHLVKMNPDSLARIRALCYSRFFPLVMCILTPSLCHSVSPKRAGVTDVHFLFTPALTVPVSHAKLHLAQMHENIVSATEKWVFGIYLKTQVWLKWAVLFCACGRVHLIPGLLSNHVSIKVKSCFFLWSKNSARRIQLLREQ